jgi:hypothetical protein
MTNVTKKFKKTKYFITFFQIKFIKMSALEAEKILSINGSMDQKNGLSKDICVYLSFLANFFNELKKLKSYVILGKRIPFPDTCRPRNDRGLRE